MSCSKNETIVRRVAGGAVAVSLLGASLHHPAWLALAAFVSVNLIQSTFTGICPLEMILERRSAGADR